MNARVAAGLCRAALLMLAVAGLVFLLVRPAAVGAADPTEVRLTATPGAETPRAPRLLTGTGLYGPDGAVDPANRPYSPQYPLWTDGATKSRWVHLPPGARIDATDVDAWQLPVGTRLWKEFSWQGHKVETRLLWRAAPDQWVYGAYVWNDAQTEAVLAPDGGVPRAYEVAPGRFHAIPGQADCRTCHASAPAVALGFSALQLSDDRDPNAPHAEPLPAGATTLGTLVAAERFAPPRPEFVTDPPRIRSADPRERAAIGYLVGNCAACHNGAGPLARLGLDLSHDGAGRPDAPEPVLLTALDAPGRYVAPGVSPDSSRILAPGSPARSSLLSRIGSRRPSAQMPPLGTALPDTAAVALLRAWIAALPASPTAAPPPWDTARK